MKTAFNDLENKYHENTENRINEIRDGAKEAKSMDPRNLRETATLAGGCF